MNDARKPLRIGILGAARIAPSAIIFPAQATGHQLVAVGARDKARATEFAYITVAMALGISRH